MPWSESDSGFVVIWVGERFEHHPQKVYIFPGVDYDKCMSTRFSFADTMGLKEGQVDVMAMSEARRKLASLATGPKPTLIGAYRQVDRSAVVVPMKAWMKIVEGIQDLEDQLAAATNTTTHVYDSVGDLAQDLGIDPTEVHALNNEIAS